MVQDTVAYLSLPASFLDHSVCLMKSEWAAQAATLGLLIGPVHSKCLAKSYPAPGQDAPLLE